MIILAIDASTKSTGYAIFEDEILKGYGCITASSTDVINRIHKIVLGLSEVFDNYKIDKIILEEVRPEDKNHPVQNIQTHRVLMWLQAAIAFLAHDRNSKIKIEYIYPSEWRKHCGIKTGRGIKREVLKQQDIAFVKKQYNIDVNDDIADAIGIGYGYTQENKEKNRAEINWE